MARECSFHTVCMIYEAYEAQTDLVDLFRPLAAGAGQALRLPWPVLRTDWPTRLLAGALETFANLTVTHARPSFGIKSISVGDRLLAVTEEAATSTPFATLLHFRKEIETPQPRVLLVAPMSGHFATLLRPTDKTMLVEHASLSPTGIIFATCRTPKAASRDRIPSGHGRRISHRRGLPAVRRCPRCCCADGGRWR